jgi:signal transduction histidine kinase
MTPSRYLLQQVLPKAKRGEQYIKVKDLIELIPTTCAARTNEMHPIIGMKELSFNYLNCNIKYQDIPRIQANFSGRNISENALLVGFIGGKFKVGRLVENLNKQPITLRPEIIPFQIKSNSITEDFFLRAIMSEVSELQGKSMSSGITITRLRKEDFLEMSILVPSLIEQQEELCKEDTRESLTESDRKILESYEDFRKDVHMKKHAIGQTLANFKNWWKLLDQVRNSGNGIIDENAVIGRIHKVSVKEIFENLESSVSKLTTQLNKFDTGYGLVKEEFALTEFIEKYIQENRSPLFRFEYNEAEHRSSEDIPEIDFDQELNGKLTGKFILKQGDPIEYVKFPKGALTKIFDNIVSNACAHGFVGREEANNIIKIEIDNVGSDYIVSVSNNGKPLDTGMKCEEITIYGQTSGDTNKHFGIGGYEIKRLMEEFGDSLEIISEPNAEFTVTYKLIFHDTNITSSFTL